MLSHAQLYDAFIVGFYLTPIGSFCGHLSSLSATKLGSIAISCALKKADVDPEFVQEVFFGNVFGANLGQAPARQAAMGAGLPNTVICTTVNKASLSGIKAVMLAAQSIQLGINDVVVAGGMESMSNIPKYMESMKSSRIGNDTIIDGILKDGIWDSQSDFGMMVSELCVEHHCVAQGLGLDNTALSVWSSNFEKLEGISASVDAPVISDGAAALVLVSGEKAKKLGLEVLGKVSGYADASLEKNDLFMPSPSMAIPKAIRCAGLEPSDIDFFEINNPFSVAGLDMERMETAREKWNVDGDRLGPLPSGYGGALLLVSLLKVLMRRGRYGVAAACDMDGEASAMVLEFMPSSKREEVLRSML